MSNEQLDQLECIKCGNEVDQILALQCEHNLCLPCSAKLYQRLQAQQYDRNQTTLQCEICSTSTLLDPSAVEVLIEMQKLGTSRSSQSNISSSRFKSVRQDYGIQVTCPQHVSEEAILYCFTCETPCFCMECFLQGLHKNHEVKNVQKSYNLLRSTKTEQVQQKVKASQDQLLQDQCKFLAKKKDLIELNANTKLQIQQNFQELYKALQLKEVELIQVADDTIGEKMREIDAEVHKLTQQMDKLNEIVNDIEKYFPENPDQSSSIFAFNYLAQNSRKIEGMTRSILQDTQNQAIMQLQYILDPQSLIQQIDDIRATKLKIMSLRGLEAVEPTNYERNFYEKAREDRSKRLFQLQTPVSENKENQSNLQATFSVGLNQSNTKLSEFERKFLEAKRCLTQRK